MKNLILVFTAIVLFQVAYAQKTKDKSFVGTITYSVTVQGELDPMYASQMPTEISTSFKGDLSRMEQKSPMGSTIIISNFETKERSILIDMMGQKIALKSTKEEIEKEMAQMPQGTLTPGTETKKIAGYTCTKSTFTQDGKSSDVYIASDLDIQNSNWQSQYKDIKGVMLEYTQSIGEKDDVKMLITAKEVKSEKIKDGLFTVPSDYKQMTMSEFKKMMGGGE